MAASQSASRDMRNRRCSHFYKLAATVAIATLASHSASAITITINPDTTHPEATFPSFDPDWSGMLAVVRDVASQWEDIYVDPHELLLNVRWQDRTDGIGVAGVVRTDSSGRVTEMNVAFDSHDGAGNEQRWFIDPTPRDHSEFSMTQTLFRDLSATQQSQFFSGSPPDLLEVGLTGSAVPGGPADRAIDLVSVAFQEIGHAFNLTSIAGADVGPDSDYDFNPDFIRGANAAAKVGTRISNGMPVPDGPHLADNFANMFASIGSGTRRVASNTDILALAAGSNWTSLDVPRTDFIGPNNGDFFVAQNWIGGRVPNGDNDTFVRHGGNMQLETNATTRDLLVDEGSAIITNDHVLRTFGDTTLGSVGVGTIAVQNFTSGTGTPELDTQNLTVNDGSIVHIVNENGLVDVHRNLQINPGGRILGAGTVEVEGRLNNNGELTGGAFLLFGTGGELTVRSDNPGPVIAPAASQAIAMTAGNSTAPIGSKATTNFVPPFAINAYLDLDGSLETGTLSATIGDLRIEGRLTDSFSSTASIGKNRTMTFTEPWTLDGTLNLDGDRASNEMANLAGGALTNRGRVQGTGNVQTTLVNRGVVAPDFIRTTRYEQTTGGTLEFRLAESSSSALRSSLGAELDGTASVELAEGFLPIAGSTFTLLTTSALGDITGQFSQLELISPLGVLFDGELEYAPEAVHFRVLAAELAPEVGGDFNRDGLVNSADYIVWRNSLGQTGPGLAADANRDNLVGPEDLDIWRTGFGRRISHGPDAPTVFAAAVPEPATASLALVMLGALLTKHGRAWTPRRSLSK